MPLYPDTKANQDFASLEATILDWWQRNNIFEQSIEQRQGAEFIFYDGPPFGNGLPHYGHLLTGYVKDSIARYYTMKGRKVNRRFGWDCHGLPAEMAAEKELGVSGKLEIEKYGITNFNTYCRDSVLRYTKEWEHYVHRQGRWVDFSRDYKTMDMDYMESVLWVFKSLYDKGLIYQALRVLPYSWACETPVSDFETRMDNAYREKVSKAVTYFCTLLKVPEFITQPCSEVRLLVWTTVAWTITSNLALAVGKDIEYSLILKDGVCYVIASALAHHYAKEIGDNEIGRCSGSDLLDCEYHPTFNYFSDYKGAFRILPGDFVTATDGTGIVSIAPGFGEEDHQLATTHHIVTACPVDSKGCFTQEVPDFQGRQVFEANDDIIATLKQKNVLIRTAQYIHSYPHCWRTDTPLIYKAVPSWYVKVTAIRDKMVHNNQQINWIPGHVKNGLFGKWLETAQDWSVSRNRYWGCPIPIWISDDPRYPHQEVYGSVAELEAAFNVKITDLHRPAIDQLVRPNPADPTGQSMLRRVPEVLDCWFESGAMPYAQAHYPFEGQESFSFPGDFVVEYVAQTRGWFYTMMVLATALFDKPPFRNAICHGVILGDKGQKLSKRLKNYPDPLLLFDNVGSDALRCFLLSSQVMQGQEIIIDSEGQGVKDKLRLVIKPLWNAYHFFTLYANIDNVKAVYSTDILAKDRKQSDAVRTDANTTLDRYILSKTFKTVRNVTVALDAYDTASAFRSIEELLEVLNNWYIRRSRERFWRSGADGDKQQAYNTLYTVLETIAKIAAPIMPFIAEAIYKGLHFDDDSTSVHLQDFPEDHANIIDHDLIEVMDKVQAACQATLHIRNSNKIRIRQPLRQAKFIGLTDKDIKPDMQRLILDEINVKECVFVPSADIEKYADFTLQLNLPLLGKRLPNIIQQLIRAAKSGQWQRSGDGVVVAETALQPEEFNFALQPKAAYRGYCVALSTSLVLLDLEVDEELAQEGMARDVIRSIQQRRKDSGLEVTDRINIAIRAEDQALVRALETWNNYISEQTLAKRLVIGHGSRPDTPSTASWSDLQIEGRGAAIYKCEFAVFVDDPKC